MGVTRLDGVGKDVPARVTNAGGKGRYVIACEHASNHLPDPFGTLGLDPSHLTRHIAWDPGALPVARLLSQALDAPLVESCISRLVIDCNRPFDAPDLVPALSETTVVPGNVGLSDADRQARIDLAHRPFHDALSQLLDERTAGHVPTMLLSVHSFTPVYKGVARPWQIGIIHDEDARLAQPMIDALRRIDGIHVGVNEPYSPADRVYYTHERHARRRGMACAMIELRNDDIADATGQRLWAGRLASILSGIEEPEIARGTESASNAKGRNRRA